MSAMFRCYFLVFMHNNLSKMFSNTSLTLKLKNFSNLYFSQLLCTIIHFIKILLTLGMPH